jgi:hypothetical protein
MKPSVSFLLLLCILIIESACSGNARSPAPDQGNNADQREDPSQHDPNQDPDGPEEKGHESPTEFKVGDLLQTGIKATTRFERLAIPDSEFLRLKTWKSETYVWARLTYKFSGSSSEENIFLACHFHGAELGCHKKETSDPSEPEDSSTGAELPPIESEESNRY